MATYSDPHIENNAKFSKTLTLGDLMVGNIAFYDFFCISDFLFFFHCVSHCTVVIDVCINYILYLYYLLFFNMTRDVCG